MGGWAVHHLVNERYKNARGAEYIGSRDIDLGFRIKKEWSIDELKKSAFAKTMNVLEQKLGFELQGFRLLKQFGTESKKELLKEDARTTPPSFIFPLYVDLMVSDNTNKDNLKKAFGFVPADEPLLTRVFSDNNDRIQTKLFEKTIFLPSIEVLLAMKLNAVIKRAKEEKQTKDLYDIVALALYAPREVEKKWLKPIYYADKDSREKLDTILNEKCIDENWRTQFGLAGETAKKIILRLTNL